MNTIATGHKVYYSRDLRDWKLFDTSENVAINSGEEAYVIGDADGVTFDYSHKTTFRMTGSISVTGDITSILDYKTLDEKIAPYCYESMFYVCTSLTQAPALPATVLAANCYSEMFSSCTSLTKAPALPATVLAANCYSEMFAYCASLTQAPTLPATTLADNCYQNMFRDCTSLTQAPTLPATTLFGNCYNQMFWGCANLSSITCLATNISSMFSTFGWLSGVAATGTFTKPASMTLWGNGASGIPNGWTVVDYTN